MPFASVDSVLEDLRNGKMVVLTDDENRENEGDLILPAQFATPQCTADLREAHRPPGPIEEPYPELPLETGDALRQ